VARLEYVQLLTELSPQVSAGNEPVGSAATVALLGAGFAKIADRMELGAALASSGGKLRNGEPRWAFDRVVAALCVHEPAASL
jgi:hypothetical protein